MKKIWTAFGCFVAGGVVRGLMYLVGMGAAGAIGQQNPGLAVGVLMTLIVLGWVGAIFFYVLGFYNIVFAGGSDGQQAIVDELRKIRYAMEDGGALGARANGDGLAEMQPAHDASGDSALDALASLTDTGHQPITDAPAPSPPTPQPAATATKPPPVKGRVLKFNCVKCEAHLAAPLEHAGKRAKCKKCGEVNDVPIG